jgi:hypothetical protein
MGKKISLQRVAVVPFLTTDFSSITKISCFPFSISETQGAHQQQQTANKLKKKKEEATKARRSN